VGPGAVEEEQGGGEEGGAQEREDGIEEKALRWRWAGWPGCDGELGRCGRGTPGEEVWACCEHLFGLVPLPRS
jgi:hypothetical protein